VEKGREVAEKNSEFIRENAVLVEKRRKDNDTLKKIQEEVKHLRIYMKTAEQDWDLLNADIMGNYLELSTITVLCISE
jgi:hypothetical protein